MFKSLVIAAMLVSSLAASTVEAYDRRGGGNWGGGRGGWGGSRGGWGGGRGWGGSGFQLNIGRGGFGYGSGYGGWGGYGRGWGGGYYGGGYNSGYYSPGYYYGQTYSSPNYYYTPGQVYTDTTVVPSGPQAPTFDGGSIVLTNPATNTETVEYALNGQMFSMRPGQSQRFTHDRDWVIEFNKGIGMGRYGLKSSNYKFKRTSNGWELFEQADSHPTTGALPPAPTNDAVRSAERLQPADESRRQESVPPPVPEADQPKVPEFTSPSDNPETTVRPREVPQP